MRLDGRAGEFFRKVYLPLFNYSATLTGTICDTPKQIDDAMKWGYGWGMGPVRADGRGRTQVVRRAARGHGHHPGQGDHQPAEPGR